MLPNSGSERKHIRILAIDGGGVRGIIPAVMLAELESRLKAPVSQLFDLVAGTSTGGILALALCQPDKGGTAPAHTASEMVDFYRQLGPAIFSKPLPQVITSLNGLIRSRYSDRPIESQLEQFFGESRLKDSLTALLVPSYELTQRTPFFFRSERARIDAAYDFPMRTVARATSAAPTYFPPETVFSSETNQKYLLVDGGVFANNPSACALVDARVQFPAAERITMVSIGTGALQPEPVMEAARNWGLAQWARPIVDTVLDGVSKTVDYQMQELMGKRSEGTFDYYRFQAHLTASSQTLDNASAETLAELKKIALESIRDRSAQLDQVCRELAN